MVFGLFCIWHDRMFYTSAPNSGTIAPRFNSIAAYDKAIEEGNKKLDELAHRQFQAMLEKRCPRHERTGKAV